MPNNFVDRIAGIHQFLKVPDFVQPLFVVANAGSISKPDTRFFSWTICRTGTERAVIIPSGTLWSPLPMDSDDENAQASPALA